MSSDSNETGYKGFAETLEHSKRKSAETIQRAEMAECARAQLDSDIESVWRVRWDTLHAEICAALDRPPPAPPRQEGRIVQKGWSQPYVDGQREQLEFVRRRMAEIEGS